MVLTYAIISVLIVSLISLVGLLTISIKINKLKKLLIYMVSFSAGALFGDVFFHLLPEIVEPKGFTLKIALSLLLGILLSFLLEKVINWRHCHIHPKSKDHIHPFAIMNLFGDAVHNFIDGLIIGASYLVSFPVGFATTLAVIFHEIPQEIGDFGVLLHGGFKKRKALLFNFLTALTSIIGAIVSFLLNNYVENLTLFLIPFAAGSFIYIAGSDLIPELHKEVKVKNSILQFIFIILGLLVMIGLLYLD